mmetsp:Transcript_15450/g.25539  ORF Transcript_15450/g.25539 Transcript_15450/m.25539 type:complete len:87 (-) Transcript_15450:3467-3727(-)
MSASLNLSLNCASLRPQWPAPFQISFLLCNAFLQINFRSLDELQKKFSYPVSFQSSTVRLCCTEDELDRLNSYNTVLMKHMLENLT